MGGHPNAMLWLVATFVLACACSDEDAPNDAVDAVPTGGDPSQVTAGAAAAAGMPPAGGEATPTAGSAGGAGVGGSVPSGVDAGGNAGSASGAGSGGAPADAAVGGSGSADASSPPASDTDVCTRELLASTVEAYFTALAAHAPSSLPLAGDVKFTENGEVLQLGEGLWQNAGAVVHHHSALDTERCGTATQAVVPEGATGLPVALRLQLDGNQITEVETIVARPGDYVIFGSPFDSDPNAIVASASLGWEDAVPEAERASHDELAAWITQYFESFPNGACNLADDCRRLENGGGSFECSLGASCSPGSSGGFGGPMDARRVLADPVTGIAAGLTMFMGHTDMHMILMRGGEVHAVHAILSAADAPGWD